MAEKAQDDPAAVVDAPADMFSFDIPEGEATKDIPKDDPFDFGSEPASPAFSGNDFSFGKEQMSAQAKAEEDAFADLLESSKSTGSASPVAQSADESSQAGWSWVISPGTTPGHPRRRDRQTGRRRFQQPVW